MDKLSSLPKGVVVGAGVLLVGLLGFAMYYFVFGMKPETDGEPVPGSVVVDMPDAAPDNYDKSQFEAYREGEALERSGSRSAQDYWNSLGDEDLVSASAAGSASVDEDELKRAGYTELEIYYITNGLKSKEEVDAERASEKAYNERMRSRLSGGYGASVPRQLTPEQQDSAYMARMEKALELAMKYQNTGGAQAGQQAAAPEPQEEEPEAVEENYSTIPLDMMGEDDDIISSLSTSSPESSKGQYTQTSSRKPVKATFLKNEKIEQGQRVIIRLMEDMFLSDGTTIPANTHLTGICEFGNRLKVNISVLHYGGRVFPVDISAYDNDGMEGIYCPSAASSKNKSRQLKQVAQGVLQSVGSTVGSLVTGNPLTGMMVNQGLSAATRSINSDGSMSVSVSSGHEFYLFENIDDK